MNWNDLKPSTQAPLSAADVQLLPPGMLIVVQDVGTALISGLSKSRTFVHFWSRDAERQEWNRGETPLSLFRGPYYLPRLPRMSFLLTEQAVRDRRKTVTRRAQLPRWWKEDRWFLGVNRLRSAGALGLCVAQCGAARQERLDAITPEDVVREGFPSWTPGDFVSMLSREAAVTGESPVWRLEFSYLPLPDFVVGGPQSDEGANPV